jgi:DNA polymerase elongation subunit (family B)
MAANGHYFRKDKQGFLPEMMQTMYDDRSKYKKLMLEWQKELSRIDNELKDRNL